MLMDKINKIMASYIRYFNIKDLNLQIILADDIYEEQKKYGFLDTDIQSIDEATSRANWKHVAACMKYPRTMSEPFYLIFKKSYVQDCSEGELYRLVFHEMTHACDYKDFARLNGLKSYRELFSNPDTVLFQQWSEYHAERRGYAAWLKHTYGVKMKYGNNKERIRDIETLNIIRFYGTQYKNVADYGSIGHVYFTMHLLARVSIWMQTCPGPASEILRTDPFKYKGLVWLKKLMDLFQANPTIEAMNDHFYDIAVIIAENMCLTKEEIMQKVDHL